MEPNTEHYVQLGIYYVKIMFVIEFFAITVPIEIYTTNFLNFTQPDRLAKREQESTFV